MRKFWMAVLLVLLAAPAAQSAWIVGQKRDAARGTTETLSITQAPDNAGPARTLGSRPFFLVEGEPPSPELYEEVLVDDLAGVAAPKAAPRADAELRTLVEQGPAGNRICLTILGDGYTEAEREKFFADAKRASDGLFGGDTFASYLPLFNVYAVFVPSQDSGITDTTPKRTAYGLYRSPPGSKRAIMPRNTLALESALRAAPRTDYPIVLANDEYYGGLGGRYAISTSSSRTGMIVLRHELGHNFGDVGEEYDGGGVYAGANSTRNAVNPPWAHWIEAKPSVHEMKFLSGEYVWQNLSQGPVRATFQFPSDAAAGPYSFDGIISFVGWSTPGEVEVLVDGSPARLEGSPTVDRGFFRLTLDRQLAPGAHRIEVREKVSDGDNVLAFATLFAYPPGYDFSGSVGAYATFAAGGTRSYRPTHEHCLMRDMLRRDFCPVDQENMWHRFLDRVSLIDSVEVSPAVESMRRVRLRAAALPTLDIRWFAIETGAERELTEFRGQREIRVPAAKTGSFKVRTRFTSPEIRRPADGFGAERGFSL